MFEGVKRAVRRMSKISDSSSSDGSVASGNEETLMTRREVKGTKALKGRQSKKLPKERCRRVRTSFWMMRIDLGRFALSLGD